MGEVYFGYYEFKLFFFDILSVSYTCNYNVRKLHTVSFTRL